MTNENSANKPREESVKSSTGASTETRAPAGGKSSGESLGKFSDTINLFEETFKEAEKKIKEFAEEIENLKNNSANLKKRQKEVETFMMGLVIFIAGVFVITSIMIALDFLKYNYERHVEYINEISNAKINLMTDKNELDKKIMGINMNLCNFENTINGKVDKQEISNLEKQINDLKSKNSYLK